MKEVILEEYTNQDLETIDVHYLDTVHVHLNKLSLNIFDEDTHLVIDVWEKDFEGAEPLFTFKHFIQEDE